MFSISIMDRKSLLQQLIENLQNIYREMQHTSDYQKYGIPFGQKAALFTVAIHRSINVKQLAAILHVTSGAATQHVDALVKERLVARSTDAHDRRTVTIVLSGKGKRLIKKLEQNRMATVKTLFADVTDDELMAYNRIMEKVNQHINQ